MFKHYLNFKDLPLIGKIQVSEPFGFDGQSHKVKQDDGRYGRDVIIANETIKLKFLKDHFEFIATPQMLIDGVPFNHASHGFEYLAYLFEQNGWESEVEYIIEKNGTSFTTGIIDFFTANVKEDEIEFSIIQNTNRELIKRREDIYIDAFSDKDLDGNAITPCQTSNILLRAKSIITESEWKSPEPFGFAVVSDRTHYCNPAQEIVKFEINDTLDWLDPLIAINATSVDIEANNFAIFKALNEMSDIQISITDLDYKFFFPIGANQRRVQQQFVLSWGYLAEAPIGTHSFFNVYYDENTPPTDYFNNSDYNYTIPYLPSGAKVFLYFRIGVDTAFSDQSVIISSLNIKVNTTETALDSVIKGIRLIDLIKHNVNSISGLPVTSNVYDIGSKNYNNFAFNGYLISQILDKKFINTFNDLMNIPTELNCDYQINSNAVEILHYDNFYRNNEISVFIELPNEENESEFNKRYFLKSLEYGYNKSSFENSENSKGTLDDVHTETQYIFTSKVTDGILKREIKHVRSSFLIENQRKRYILDKKTLTNDDTLFLLDVVPLSGGDIEKEINRYLKYFEGKIYSDGTFNWLLMGISVGDVITINSFPVTVTAIDNLILSTNGNLGVGSAVLFIKYTLTNVDYISRGEENFTQINGVSNPKNYANLKYHIKRNLKYFESYLATAGKYIANTAIKNTVFRVNDKLETKMYNENALVKDKSDIAINDIAIKKILNPIIHNITVFCEFEEATDFFKKVETDKGFVRIKTVKGKIVKGYPMEADYSWTENKLTLKLEERYEGDYLTIDKVSGTIFINSIGYGMNLGLDNFKINNNFVCLYDSNNILIANPISFEKIKINNVLYTDLVLFSNALFSLI